MGEVFEYFHQQTLSAITSKLQSFAARADQLSMLIKEAEDDYNNQQKMLIADYQNLLKYKKNYWDNPEGLDNIQSRLVQARESLHLNHYYLEGYKLLNEVGHYLHEAWNYSITLFGKETYTFQMPMEEFLKFSEATVEGFKLKSQSSILSQLSSIQQNKNINTIQWDNTRNDRYNKTFYNAYKYVINKARAILINGGKYSAKKYNAGQILEGYMAFGENVENLTQITTIRQLVHLASRRHLGLNNFGTLEDSILDVWDQLKEQTNNRGFWTGGDTLKEGQVKGANASVFQFSTIRNQLEKIKLLFSNLNFTPLEKRIQQAQGPAREALKQEVQKTLDRVVEGFDATIIKIGADNLNTEINTIIQSLLN